MLPHHASPLWKTREVLGGKTPRAAHRQPHGLTDVRYRLTSIWKTITEDRFMTRKLPKRGLPPMHPGELLREEILPALDRPRTEIARLLGVSRQTLYDVLKEKQPVTPVMALRLGKLCGNGPDLWLNLQKRYDLHQAERELGEKIKNIPTLEVA